MDITFTNHRLEDLMNDERKFIRKYGQQNFKELTDRMMVLINSNNLSEISIHPPERCHELKGNRKGTFAVLLKNPLRLIFEPDHDPVPTKEDGGIDLTQVTAITILEITDYH